MVEIWTAFAGPLRKIDTAPSTPGVDVSHETSMGKMRIAILLAFGIGSGFALFAYLNGWWTFEQAVHALRMNPTAANDN